MHRPKDTGKNMDRWIDLHWITPSKYKSTRACLSKTFVLQFLSVYHKIFINIWEYTLGCNKTSFFSQFLSVNPVFNRRTMLNPSVKSLSRLWSGIEWIRMLFWLKRFPVELNHRGNIKHTKKKQRKGERRKEMKLISMKKKLNIGSTERAIERAANE